MGQKGSRGGQSYALKALGSQRPGGEVGGGIVLLASLGRVLPIGPSLLVLAGLLVPVRQYQWAQTL